MSGDIASSSELMFMQEVLGSQQLTEYGRQLIKRMIAENPESVEYRVRGETQWKTLKEMIKDLQEDKYEWQPRTGEVVYKQDLI